METYETSILVGKYWGDSMRIVYDYGPGSWPRYLPSNILGPPHSTESISGHPVSIIYWKNRIVAESKDDPLAPNPGGLLTASMLGLNRGQYSLEIEIEVATKEDLPKALAVIRSVTLDNESQLQKPSHR